MTMTVVRRSGFLAIGARFSFWVMNMMMTAWCLWMLLHWDRLPANAGRLMASGVAFWLLAGLLTATIGFKLKKA